MISYPGCATVLAKGVGSYGQTIVFHFSDDSTLTLTNSDILGDTGVEIEDAVSSQDSIQIGATIINQCTFTIANFNGTYDNKDFMGARFTVSISIKRETGQVVSATKGTFYVVEQKFAESAITIIGYDAMHLLDKPFSSVQITYPTSLGSVLGMVASACGVTMVVPQAFGSITVNSAPSSSAVTCREVVSWAAQMLGYFARTDVNGVIRFGWYDLDTLGNDSASSTLYHTIQSTFSRQISKADVTITGIKIVIDESNSVKSGTDDYMLEISGNEFITAANAQTILSNLATKLIGMTFRKMDISHLSDPRMEAGDVFKLVVGSNHYWGIVSYTKFTAGGSQVTRSDAEDPVYVQSTRYTQVTKLAAQTAADIAKEADARQTAIDHATDMITGATGGNYIEIIDTQTNKPVGWAIIDADNIADATNVWRFTAGGLGHSHSGWDGPYSDIALTADGHINADLITVGTLRSLQIINGNNGEFSVDTNGNVIAKAISIQGGSINITTQTDSYDVIQLNYQQNGEIKKTYQAPLGFYVESSAVDPDTQQTTSYRSVSQAGGLLYYIDNVVRGMHTPTSVQFASAAGVTTAAYGSSFWALYDASGTGRLYTTATNVLCFDDAAGVARARFGESDFNLYGSDGKRRYRQTTTSFYLNDNTEQTRFQIEAQRLSMFSASGAALLRLGVSDGLKIYDSAGSIARAESGTGGVKVRNSSGDVVAELNSTYGIGISNTSGSFGLMIDGVGYSQATGSWGFKEITTSDNRKVRVPSFTVTAETARIPANSNLDNYMTNGNYVCYNADASSITNTPYTSAFMLNVALYAPNGGDATSGIVVQTLYPGNSTINSIYVRRRYGSSFGAWREYIGNSESSANISSGASSTFTFLGNGALVYAKRGSDYLLAVVDYWTAGAVTIASSGTTVTITHAASSKDVTITNARSSGAVQCGFFGV